MQMSHITQLDAAWQDRLSRELYHIIFKTAWLPIAADAEAWQGLVCAFVKFTQLK